MTWFLYLIDIERCIAIRVFNNQSDAEPSDFVRFKKTIEPDETLEYFEKLFFSGLFDLLTSST